MRFAIEGGTSGMGWCSFRLLAALPSTAAAASPEGSPYKRKVAV